jgi:hypothetical protein
VVHHEGQKLAGNQLRVTEDGPMLMSKLPVRGSIMSMEVVNRW